MDYETSGWCHLIALLKRFHMNLITPNQVYWGQSYNWLITWSCSKWSGSGAIKGAPEPVPQVPRLPDQSWEDQNDLKFIAVKVSVLWNHKPNHTTLESYYHACTWVGLLLQTPDLWSAMACVSHSQVMNIDIFLHFACALHLTRLMLTCFWRQCIIN